jgi:hypothetical protein
MNSDLSDVDVRPRINNNRADRRSSSFPIGQTKRTNTNDESRAHRLDFACSIIDLPFVFFVIDDSEILIIDETSLSMPSIRRQRLVYLIELFRSIRLTSRSSRLTRAFASNII